jgi:hypothetical protein
MRYGRLLLILLALAGGSGYVALQTFAVRTADSAVAPAEQFPIVPRFELPQAYGYFIGDEIPVTLVIETAGEVVLDLINLPQAGSKFGPFEIRALHLTSTALPQGAKVYRAAYTLQYFGPTPFTTVFGPLEILYALPASPRGSAPTYTYQRLLTQPAVIHMSRLGPRHSPHPAPIKGDVSDARTGPVWTWSILGTLLVLTATGGWAWEQFTSWQRRRRGVVHPPTVTRQVLQTLRHEATVLFSAPEGAASLVGARLEHILREYVQAIYQVPAFTLTTSELATQLGGTSQAQDIVRLLQQCEALKYQSPLVPPAVERALWWNTITLFEKLQGEHKP